MGRMVPLTTLKQISDINLTPLMDVVFLLLITFIITFPMIEQGVQINLPQGSASPLPADVSRSVVSLDGKGNLYLDDRPVSFDALLAQFAALAQADSKATVYVRADSAVPYGDVVRVLRALHELKLTRISLVTRADK